MINFGCSPLHISKLISLENSFFQLTYSVESYWSILSAHWPWTKSVTFSRVRFESWIATINAITSGKMNNYCIHTGNRGSRKIGLLVVLCLSFEFLHLCFAFMLWRRVFIIRISLLNSQDAMVTLMLSRSCYSNCITVLLLRYSLIFLFRADQLPTSTTARVKWVTWNLPTSRS